MKTIRYQGYEATQGSTRVMLFWSDMHDLDFRADKAIESFADLKDQVERFTADRTQFDVNSYATGSKEVKAVREYDCIVQTTLDFHVIVFEYQGKKYRTRTRKYFSLKRKIEQNGKIISHEVERIKCSVWDSSDEIVEEFEVISKMNYYPLI